MQSFFSRKASRFLAVIALSGIVFVGAGCGTQPSVDQNQNGDQQSQDDMIRITAPTPNALVTSPLTITGTARGNWYFEASFPVQLVDANGAVLATAPAQAQGDWMTTEFVPFSVTLTFPTPSTATGTLIFHKDNASGLPEFDDSRSIGVRFTP